VSETAKPVFKSDRYLEKIPSVVSEPNKYI